MFEEEQRHELVFYRTPLVIGRFLRGLQMDIPEGHPSGVDVRAFMPRIHDKLEEEILALNGVKFQLALKVQLRKDNPDGSEEYTDPELRHKQEAILQASEINENLNRVIPYLLELLEKWTQRGSGWLVDRVQTLWMNVARYQPLKGGSYLPLPAAVRNKKAVINPKTWMMMTAWNGHFLSPRPIHNHHIIQRGFHGMPPKKVNITLPKLIPQRPSLRFQNSKNCLIKPSMYLAA